MSASDDKLAEKPVAQQRSFGAPDDDDANVALHWRSWFVVAACGLYYGATLIVLLSTGFWLQVIEASIGGASVGLWLSQSYNIVNAVLGPIAGQIGDTCGRRYLMLFGLAMGCVGCAIIATAKSMNVAIVGATIYGLDWMLVANAFSICSEVTTRRWRTRAQSFMNVCGSVGIIFAVFAGAGFILHNPGNYPGWRSCFWLAFAMIGAAFAMFAVFYFPEPPPNPKQLSVFQRFLACDLVGSALLACSLTPILLGLIWGGVSYPWSSAPVVASLVVGFFFAVVLGLHQYFIKKDGLFAHSMFSKRNVQVSVFGMMTEGMIYITFNQYYGFETAVLFEPRTLLLALRFSCFLFGNILGSVFVQYLSYRYRRVKELVLVGFTLFAVGLIMLIAANEHSNGQVIAAACIMGFGFSAPIAMLISVAQLAVRPDQIGLVSGLLISARSVGGAVGVAIATAVFSSKLKSSLPVDIATAAIAAGLPESSVEVFVTGLATNNITLAESAPGVTAAILQAGGGGALRAYAHSFRYIWAILVPFTALSFIGCVFLKPINKEMNKHVDRTVEAAYIHEHEHDHEGKDHTVEHVDNATSVPALRT